MIVPQEQERWTDFPGSNGTYEVSSLGRVRSHIRSNRRKGEFLRPTQRDDGYLQLSFFGKSWLLHRAVLTAFVGPSPEGFHGAHLDGVKTNCALSNLAWVSVKENSKHRIAHGTMSFGAKNPMAKVTEETVRAIRARCIPRSKTDNCTALAKEYGLSFQAVWDIVKRRRWAHIQ